MSWRCFFGFHRWERVREVCHWSVLFTQFHPLAGCSATCGRCGKQWLDQCGRCP